MENTEQKKKIGFFGGTFDPIHFGHINLAIELRELRALDEIWFCPAQSNPLKTQAPSSSALQRLNMLKLAVADIPFFKVIDNEILRPAPSYTIDTLNELTQANPGYVFSLILGEDSISCFFRWNQPLEITVKAAPLIGCRTGEMDLNRYSGENPEILKALSQGITQTSLMDISATLIRDRLARGLYCGHLLPAKVIDDIKQNNLYFANK